MTDRFDPLRCYLNCAEERGLNGDVIARERSFRLDGNQPRVVYESVRNSHGRSMIFETRMSFEVSGDDLKLYSPWDLLRPKVEGHRLKLMGYEPVEAWAEYCVIGLEFQDIDPLFGQGLTPEYGRLNAIIGEEARIREIVDIFIEGFSEEDKKGFCGLKLIRQSE